jgi:hypothetical protein
MQVTISHPLVTLTAFQIRLYKFYREAFRTSPLGTSATNWPVVPALDDR